MKKGEDWEKLVREHSVSGRSVSQFCRDRGVTDSAFGYWRKKLGERESGTFARVATGDLVSVELPGGKLVRVNRNDLRAVLEALCVQ